jgi:hypothetical protein
MTGRTKIGYFTKLDPVLREALRRYKAAVGVPEAEQIDRALRDWLGKRAESGLASTPKAKRKSSRRSS